MAANVRTEMRIPTRSAPRPPVNPIAQRNNLWGSTNDIFGTTLMQQSVQKKKPPPRPPPPKFNQNHARYQRDQKPKKPARPTELLTNFFGRKTVKNEHAIMYRSGSQLTNATTQATHVNGTVSLIDLSPPGSPTFTTRSSSDGVSIDSFGSDGNSNPSAFTSSGNTSQTESAFEDDFDFFGTSSSKRTMLNDPWQIKTNQNPFGQIETTTSTIPHSIKQVGDTTRFFAFNNENFSDKQTPFGQSNLKPPLSMPTIIRPRPLKPPAPKVNKKTMEMKVNENQDGLTSLCKTIVPFDEPVSLDLACSWNDNVKDSPSPPMPTIPPPAPPPEYLAQTGAEFKTSSEKPYGIAMYDFFTTHPGDLPMKEGDIVTLIKVVNNDWMEGCVGDRQGIFPTNFVDIKVPLPGQENLVTALYSFNAETADDLSFEEGAKITVFSRISEDWLYGECEGRRGQFPANYVNRVPSNIAAPSFQ